MSIIKDRAIVVTGPITRERAEKIGGTREGEIYVDDAHEKAKELFEGLAPVTDIHRSKARSSFAILPDGSKEGWTTCEESKKRREHFLLWLEDNDTALSWEKIDL